MRTLIAILIVLLAVLGALYALGVFESSAPAPEDGGETPPPNEAEDGARLNAPPPDDPPPLEVFPIRDEIDVLLLTRYVERLPATLALHWGGHPLINVHAWAPEAEASPGSGAPPPDRLANTRVLDSPPTGPGLHERGIDVVVLHAFPPDRLDREFWEALVERVRDGRTGLLVLPGRPEGQVLLDDPTLQGVLPIGASKRMEGTPIPGVFGALVPFEPTPAGLEHPASRLVAWPSWSKIIWQARREGAHPWGATMAWPVETPSEGATVLLEVAPPRGGAVPIMIAREVGDGRVLWMGAFDLLSRQAHGDPEVMKDLQAWVRNWVVWLAKRV